MTIKIQNQTFEGVNDWGYGKVFSDTEFIHCSFIGCGFSSVDIANFDNLDFVGLRSIAKNLNFCNCQVKDCHVGPGIVENVTIDGLKVLGHLQTDGTVFKHVVIKGVIDRLMLTPHVDIFGHFPDVQRSFDEANRVYYENVDWALDISEAQFRDCDIRGIPSRLIRRDRLTQAVLTREKAIEGKWRELNLAKTYWPTSIEFLIEQGHQDAVLAAPKHSRNFKNLVEGLYRLRDAGIVDLD